MEGLITNGSDYMDSSIDTSHTASTYVLSNATINALKSCSNPYCNWNRVLPEPIKQKVYSSCDTCGNPVENVSISVHCPICNSFICYEVSDGR